ncbi:hypothetical protein GCM10010435_65750 [Winogradskya consettensis]|uniref:SGNH hydrolase-type esterase domain-containing protein n=1 Tax=Winogradskya consettensis TaxID=113560 RepID=A0A919T4I9_9ACTN|nr:SGNH/GDSL hydrolase family protein [Actinoplanes consettensis]GIM84824.1 hypothetical protein Aco04nite_93340 [Actinoplanes consettensis]
MGVREQGKTGVRRLGLLALTGVLATGAAAFAGAPQIAAAVAAPAVTPAVAATSAPATPWMAAAQSYEATRVMPLGDSITRGTGSPTRSSYRMDLADRLIKGGMEINYVGSQSDGTGSNISHEGHGGWTIDELSENLDSWLSSYRPDVVLVHAGTNNITQGDGPYTTARKLSAMIDQIRADRPEAQLFVAQIIMSRVPREAAQDRIYNSLIPGVVASKHDNRITVVDQSSVGGIDLHDLHHPNDFGYSKMAWNWYQAMSRVFGTSGNTGANPYRMSITNRCLATKVDGSHRTDCRTWVLRPTGSGSRTWQTLRETKRTYRVRVNGKLHTRQRIVRRWTGPGNLLNV